MKVICAWCSSTLREDSDSHAQISHGICDECGYTLLNQRGIGIRQLLKDANVPVIIVNRDREVQDDFQDAPQKLGRVIGCANAKCCGGCGGSASCGPCSLREAITRTHADGNARFGIVSEHPIHSKRDATLSVHFSTAKIDDNVLVIFEQRTVELGVVRKNQ
jgi:hypothetical protein